MPTFVIPIIVAVALIIVFVVIFRSMWRVAEPNEALIISGMGHGKATDQEGDDLGFRIVSGRGTLVIPGLNRVRSLSLDMHRTNLTVDCVTQQGLPVHIEGTVLYKVGDNPEFIASAARRFLDRQNELDDNVHNVFAGHVRTIIGSLTVEDLIRERDKLTEQTRNACSAEMQKLGLIVDSLQIQGIQDRTGYIENLARPHTANVERDARIAAAAANQAAVEAEQAAIARNAEVTRDTAIKTAGFDADTNKAQAEADQAGPLAEATAKQAVVTAQTTTAQLEADRVEQELQATVRKPADAEAYAAAKRAEGLRNATIAEAEGTRKQTEELAAGEAARTKLTAEAEAEATRLRGTAAGDAGEAEARAVKAKGEAEGSAIKAKGEAEGAAIRSRSEALAENQDAVIAQQIAEHMPEIVAAAAKTFDGIDNMVVLNGAEGITQAIATIAAQASTGFGLLRQLTANGSSPNGTTAEASAEKEGHSG